MLEAYPTKKWFVVLGDDNYVLLDNYVNVLSAFDPEQPWALSRMVHRNKFGCKVQQRMHVVVFESVAYGRTGSSSGMVFRRVVCFRRCDADAFVRWFVESSSHVNSRTRYTS